MAQAAHPNPITMPYSASRPRIWLALAVRCLIEPERTRWRAWMCSCSIVLTGTKRIPGRLTASQMASASLASFVCCL